MPFVLAILTDVVLLPLLAETSAFAKQAVQALNSDDPEAKRRAFDADRLHRFGQLHDRIDLVRTASMILGGTLLSLLVPARARPERQGNLLFTMALGFLAVQWMTGWQSWPRFLACLLAVLVAAIAILTVRRRADSPSGTHPPNVD